MSATKCIIQRRGWATKWVCSCGEQFVTRREANLHIGGQNGNATAGGAS